MISKLKKLFGRLGSAPHNAGLAENEKGIFDAWARAHKNHLRELRGRAPGRHDKSGRKRLADELRKGRRSAVGFDIRPKRDKDEFKLR